MKSRFAGNGTEYGTYKEALAANDFYAAHRIFDMAETELSKCDNKADRKGFAKRFGFEASKTDLENVKKEIFHNEVKHLAIDGSPVACEKLIILVADYEIKGNRLPEGRNG